MTSWTARAYGPGTRLFLPCAASFSVVLASFAVVLATAASASPGLYENTGQCVEGTFQIRHGVTAVQITAIGAAGEDGQDVTTNQFGGTQDWPGGTGGLGSRVTTTIPVTYGMTLYVGVANSGMPGGSRSGDNRGGKGGAASWVTDTDPRVNGECKPKQANVVVAAAGGGGGGGAGNRAPAHPGGAGGIEANGGNGGAGAESTALFDDATDAGGGGLYSNGTSGGAGGTGGSSPGCTGGTPGAAGATVSGGAGGAAGLPFFGEHDCSSPPPNCYACSEFSNGVYGGGGGGGGGGLWGGGGGGGADSSGYGAGGGGASGRSYARNPLSYSLTSTRVPEMVTIQAVTTPVDITSGNAATFTRGTFGSTIATATGVDTPFVRFLGDMPQGVSNSSATFPDDGSGAGSATLSGTPSEHGVFPLEVDACNSTGCLREAFTLTVNGSPSFTSPDTNTFLIGSAGSHTITTSAYPAAAITQTGAPAWLTLTDHGNGTATLAGTPPAGAPSTVTVNLTAANGIGSNATQTLTLKVVTALVITPSTVHLVPGSNHPSFDPWRRGFEQQLRAMGTFTDGSTADLTGYVRWSSSDAAIASVTSGALVKAHTLGTATITAGTAAVADPTAAIIVAMPLSIAVTPATVDLMGGETQQFAAIGCYATPCTGANVFDITRNVRWFTTNLSASITADGLATANAGGTSVAVMAELAAGLPGIPSVRGEGEINVTHGDVVEVVVTPDDITVPTRTVVRYRGMLRYQDGTLAHDSPYVTWSASGITGATIGPAGDAYSPDPGTLTVRGSFTNPGGGVVHGETTLTVIRLPQSLLVSPVSGSSLTPLVKGRTRQYKALAHYIDGSPDLDVTNGVEWVSTEPADVSMSATGLATALASNEGESATVYARYTYDNGAGGTSELTGNSVVTVTLLPPVSIAITPTSPSVLHPGDSLQFAATGTYADGSTVDLTNAVKDVDEDGHATYHVMWQSTNTFVGVVNDTGNLHIPSTGPTAGTLTVSASILSGGGVLHSNDVVVTVTDPLHHIHLHSLAPGGSPQFITAGVSTPYPYWVEGFDSHNHSLGDVTDGAVISMSPDGACDPVTHTCRATVADIGSARHTISAYHPGAVNPNSQNVQIWILRAATQRIEVTGGSLAIIAGQSTAPYHVTGYDTYDNVFDATNQTSFTISPVETGSGCANNATGTSPTCFAVNDGAHTVRASYQSGAFVTLLPLWVHPSTVIDHITLSGGSSTVPVGTTTQRYTVTGFDPYGNSGDLAGQTVLEISPDGTCDNAARTCTPASAGAHTVVAKHVNDGMASNALALASVGPPTLAVSFSPTEVVKGSLVNLRFTVTNPNTVALTGIGWTATVPPSLVANSFPNTCNNPGFVFSTPPGGFVMSGVTLNAGASCTFTYNAQATAAGAFSSTMSNLTSTNGGNSAQTATANLVVTGPPLLRKSFVAGSVPVGSTTPLTFTVTNPNTALTLTGIGFFDTLPAGLSFASTTVTGSCGGGVISIQGNRLYLGPDGATGAIGGPVNGASLAPGTSCTFSADVVADTLGTKNNTTSNVTSTERGTGPQGQATVVVSPPVNHFDIELQALTAGEPTALVVTARDMFGNVMTDYAGQPTLTGDFTASDTGCGAGDAEPCVPTYSMPPFVAGVGQAIVTAYHLEFSRSVTVSDGSVTNQSSQGLLVGPGSFDHLTLEGGSASISAGGFTDSYFARHWDKYGNLRPGGSFTISISPDGLCNGVDICGAQVADSDGSHHTVTATNVNALHPTATRPLVVGHGQVSSIVLDGGNRTLPAGGTTQPYTYRAYDLWENELNDLPVSDVNLTISPNGTCAQVARTCTASVADAPGWYHSVRVEHVNGPFDFGDDLVVSAGPLDHLVLNPATSSVAPGQYQSYLAVGYDAYGNALGDKTGLATFTVDGGDCTDSSCHAASAGDHTVTATLGSATGTATLTVVAGQLHHIALTAGSASIVVGTDTAPYVVQGYDGDGNPLGDVTSGATLSISPEGTCDDVAHTCTADVADNGGFHVVTATHPGAIGGPTAIAELVVTDVPIDHIALTGGSSSVTAGTMTAPYVVTAYDIDDNVLGTVTSDVTFSIAPDGFCSQPNHTCTSNVADSGGSHHTVTATHPTATIPTATSDVVVTDGGGGGGGDPGTLDHFGIAVHDIGAGEWGAFTVTAYDADGVVVTGYSGPPTITGNFGDSDSACGPIGQDPCPPDYFLGGFVNGSATTQVRGFRADTGRTVTVTDGTVTSTSDPFTIKAGDLDHVTLTGGSTAVAAGENTAPYVVTGYDIFGNALGDLTGDSTFTILPSGTCTGAVCSSTSVGPKVVMSDTDGFTKTKDLLVTAGPLATIYLSGDPFAQAGVPTSPYRVDGFDATGNFVGDVTGEVTLSIGPDGSCEDVTHTCNATAADAFGSSTHLVTATHPDVRNSALSELFVFAGFPDHLVLSPDEATIAAGAGQAFTATVADSFGNPIGDVTADTTFSVTGGSCTAATCGATTLGDHTVTGTLNELEGTATLRVNPGPLDHITLTGGSTSVNAGTATAPYQVEGWDAYGNDLGDVTGASPLSITPDGTCDQTAHTCTPAAGGAHVVTATNSAATNPTATRNLSVTSSTADLRLTKTGPATVVPGTTVTYQLSAQNFGPATATNVTVSDPYPAGTSFVSETHPSGWTCTTAGTLSCTRASLTTADGAQAFTLSLHVDASYAGQVSNTASITSSTTDSTPANNTPPAVVSTVGCTNTITGLYAGDLTLSGAGTTCLRNVTVTGKLTVVKNATLVAINAVVNGAVSTNGSGALTFCGSTLRSSVNINAANGFVLFGDPGDDVCAGNVVTGSISVTDGKAGLNVRSNVLQSSLNVDKNKGGGPFPVDANPIVAANRLAGRLGCKSNTPAPINAGQPNVAPTKSGQCAGL